MRVQGAARWCAPAHPARQTACPEPLVEAESSSVNWYRRVPAAVTVVLAAFALAGCGASAIAPKRSFQSVTPSEMLKSNAAFAMIDQVRPGGTVLVCAGSTDGEAPDALAAADQACGELGPASFMDSTLVGPECSLIRPVALTYWCGGVGGAKPMSEDGTVLVCGLSPTGPADEARGLAGGACGANGPAEFVEARTTGRACSLLKPTTLVFRCGGVGTAALK